MLGIYKAIILDAHNYWSLSVGSLMLYTKPTH